MQGDKDNDIAVCSVWFFSCDDHSFFLLFLITSPLLSTRLFSHRHFLWKKTANKILFSLFQSCFRCIRLWREITKGSLFTSDASESTQLSFLLSSSSSTSRFVLTKRECDSLLRSLHSLSILSIFGLSLLLTLFTEEKSKWSITHLDPRRVIILRNNLLSCRKEWRLSFSQSLFSLSRIEWAYYFTHSQTKHKRGERRTVAFKNKTGITRRERDSVEGETDTGQLEK